MYTVGHENKQNNHQIVLMFQQILPTGTIRNIENIVRGKYVLTLVLKRLTSFISLSAGGGYTAT